MCIRDRVGADQYIDTDKHTWSTDGFLKTVDALYNGGYENVAAIYCAGQGGDQGTRAIINNMYGGTFTDAAPVSYTHLCTIPCWQQTRNCSPFMT